MVEDQQMLRELAQECLERMGYNVLVASHGREAVEIATRHLETIDVLLTDVIMPELNGPEVAQRLRALRPEMRVLYMSGYTGDAIAHQGMLDPGVDYIQKPFRPAVLARKVADALQKNSPAENVAP